MFNQFDQARQFMTPETMKSMGSMFAGMDDNQIRQYAQMAGMGNMDPNFIRQQMGAMQNMNNDDLKQKVDQVANKLIIQVKPEQLEEAKRRAQQLSTPNTPPPQQQQQQQQSQSQDPYPIITRLKNRGNEAFNKQDYDSAASKYYEAISEIEELWENNSFLKNNEQKHQELKILETSCRLNYCNVKSKQNQFDIVKRQAQMVLNYDSQNGKANYRMAQALNEAKQYQIALSHIQIAATQLPNDQPVKDLLASIQQQLNLTNSEQTQQTEQKDNQKDEQQQQQQQQQQEQEQKQESQQQKQQQQQQQQSKQDQDEILQPKKQKVKLESVDTSSKEFQDLKEKATANKIEDGLIEEEPITTSTIKQQPPPQIQQGNSNIIPPMQNNFNDPQFKQQFDNLKNMSPQQMEQMTSMVKNMDKNMLRSMMKQQSGMDISDAQIEVMQKMMTPEMMSSMKNMDPNLLQQKGLQQAQPQFTQPSSVQQSQSNQQQQQQQQFPQQQQQEPSMGAMAQNPEMIKMLIEQLKSNPQMLKAMAPMFGKNAFSNYIENSTPEQLSKLVGRLAIFLQFLLVAYRAYLFIKQQWKFIAGFLLAFILFKLL